MCLIVELQKSICHDENQVINFLFPCNDMSWGKGKQATCYHHNLLKQLKEGLQPRDWLTLSQTMKGRALLAHSLILWNLSFRRVRQIFA